MKSIAALFLAAHVLACAAAEISVRPGDTLNPVDERIYGFLLEHIYRSCSAGIWGEEVFNRSFEQRANLPGCPIAEAALMLRHTSATGWDNAFINFDRRGWYYAPNGVVFKLWSETSLPRRIAASGDFGGLDVVECASEDGSRISVKVVNVSGAEVPLSLALPEGYSIRRVRSVHAGSLDVRNTMESPDAVAVRDIPFAPQSLTIPAYSATVVELCR